jgi:hypothetical protein
MGVGRFALAVLFGLCAIGCGDQQEAPLSDAGVEIAVGMEFVAQRGCPRCHQSSDPHDGTLSGQTTPQPGTMAYPANLTPDHTTGIGDWADIEVIRAMRYGFDNQGLPLCAPMPHAADMTEVESQAIVAYLRSLPAVKRAIPASLCPPIKPMPPVDMAVPPSPVDMASVD